jgi:DNA polymerase III epsilon subunit-like protein
MYFPASNATQKMLVLVIDTETTGLPPRTSRNAPAPSFDELAATWPHVVQLSGILFDTEEKTVVEMFDHIIKIPANVPLPDESVAIHGISREMCETQGIDIKAALISFAICFEKAHCVVAHNLVFDKTVLQVELHRNDYVNIFNKQLKLEYCTMKYGDKITNLTMISKFSGKPIRKSPKLVELYEHLFGVSEKPLSLHNSLIDVLICARCYTKMSNKQDMFDWEDETIEKMKTMLYL